MPCITEVKPMDKAKKKTIKRAVTWILLAALVALLSVMPLLARQEQEADGPVASILEATAQVGSVSTFLKGGGTLEAGKAMKVNLPGGVKIKEFLVKNGDIVTEGTPVATVDRVSVMNAILGVEDTMEYLRKQIAAADDDTVSGTIKATAGGRVKKIYAQKGDSVQDVMLTYGSLAVLSLDGRMAVELQTQTLLAAGDTVKVTIAGETADGRVESNLNGKLIISLEDKKYAIGQSVSVATRQGEAIGTGELYVHNAWHATAFSGTVKNVNAKEETEVNAGTTLLTLEDTDFEGTLQSLANLHREYEELLQRLFVMYETEVLTAPCDGMVSGIDKNSPHLLAAIDGEQGWFVDLLSSGNTDEPEKGWTIQLLGNADAEPVCTGDENCEAKGKHDPEKNCPKNICDKSVICSANEHDPACKTNCQNKEGCTAKAKEAHLDTCPEKCLNSDKCKAGVGNHLDTCPMRCTGLFNCGAVHHEDGCLCVCKENDQCRAPLENHKPECPYYCDETKECDAPVHKDNCPAIETKTYIGYAAIVTGVTDIDGSRKALHLSVVGTPYEITYTNKWDFGSLDIKEVSGAVPVQTPYYTTGSYKAGEIVVVAYENAENYTIVKTGQSISLPNMDLGSMLGGLDLSALMGGFSFGNFGAYGAYGGAAANQVQLYDLDGSTLMTVTDRDTMTLTIAIDEQDISKVSRGQTAQVEVTSIRGQTFEAEVTEVGNFGTNNGGSSKFSVELTMDQEEQMLSGMNATAQIPMYTKMDVLTIPVAALVDTVNGTCVYTALDKKTGEPAAPVAVETGVSDGETVEILSGLNAGDKVYYSYYDVLELDHTAKTEFAW